MSWKQSGLCLSLLGGILYSSCKEEHRFHMPSALEPHDAIWIGWEEDTTLGYAPSMVDLIQVLNRKVSVKLVFRTEPLMLQAKEYLANWGVDSSMYTCTIMGGDRFWIRDYGAQFIVNDHGELGAVDFAYDGYGYPHFLQEHFGNSPEINGYLQLLEKKISETDSVDSLMASETGAVLFKSNVVFEGGAGEANGRGTLLLSEEVVFERNPGLDRKYIEREFKRVLGVSKIIWLKYGLAEDPLHSMRRVTGNYIAGGTGGHTDEFVRFANPNIILMAWIDVSEIGDNPILQMNYNRMRDNLHILETSTDQDGRPFKIIKVPMPNLVVKSVIARNKMDKYSHPLDVLTGGFIPSEAPSAGDTLLRLATSSYLNFIVTNGVVILPTYLSMGTSLEKETQVKHIFETQFPNHEIVFVNVMPLNWKGGGLHCSTMEQPSPPKYYTGP